MKLGIAMFPADFALRPDELARAVEERGFDSLFFPEHTHIPATPRTRALMEQVQGGAVGAHFAHTYDLFVALTYVALVTGASSGIGLATAQTFAAAGGAVLVGAYIALAVLLIVAVRRVVRPRSPGRR